MNMNVKAVLFDMDGTLVDTEHLHQHAWDMATQHFGDDGVTHEEYTNYAGRDGIDNATLIVSVRPNLRVSPEEILNKKNEIFEENLVKGVKFVEGAEEALEECKRLGLRVALATGGPRNETEQKMLTLKIGHHFEHVITATEVENKKPHPQTYMDAYSALGVRPEQCVAVEDTEHGVASAVGAGVYCIAKPTPTTKLQDFSKANVVVDSLDEAMQHIKDLMNQN